MPCIPQHLPILYHKNASLSIYCTDFLQISNTPSPNWLPAILFYLLFIVGILFFVVAPGLESNSIKVILLRAALFGLITYATYDLTNLAALKDWPALLSMVDMLWGTFLNVSVSCFGFIAGKRLA